MKAALAGNPNSGKTTLFNELTKLNQRIGNWPGVTVERKQGKCYADKSIEIIDLPGVYSLSPISEDEKVTYKYLMSGKPDVIINIIDSTSLDRSLLLTLQLLETDIPVVLALNMEDELKRNGLTLDTEAIENELKAPVILISARKNTNIDKLIEKVKETAKNKKQESFTALGETQEEKADYRYRYIASKINLFRKKTDSKAKRINDKIDKIVMNKWLAFPIFAFVIWLMYFVSVQTVGAASINFMEYLFFDLIGENLRIWLVNIGAAPWVVSLTADGIIAGTGAVLSFIPQLLMLFLFITFLEGCGYMARVAVIMDKLFRRLGLSGKSFIPMIIGCGCSVPAIMSAKTVEGENERKATIMLAPFIPCSAKLPVFALIAGALFPNNSFVAPSMYFLGIFMVIIGGLVLKAFRKNKVSNDTFILEMPHYRLPKLKNILIEIWEKIREFIVRAGVIIVPAAIILWFLQSFNFSFRMVDIEDSMLAAIGGGIAWLFAPLGFGNWQSSIAIVTGIFAKETVVATFGVLLGGEGTDLNVALSALFTPQAAYAFMAFILLSAPCIAAIAATKKETGSAKWMFIAIAFQCGLAYIVALIINQIGNFWMYNRTLCISVIAGLLFALLFGLCIYYLVRSKKKDKGCAAGCSGCARKNNCNKK